MSKTWGEWAFFFGIILAIIIGFFGNTDFVSTGNAGVLLAILGLIVGFLNVTRDESNGFLIATIALLLVGSAGLEQLPSVGPGLGDIFNNIGNFVAPAALVVALKMVTDLAKKA